MREQSKHAMFTLRYTSLHLVFIGSMDYKVPAAHPGFVNHIWVLMNYECWAGFEETGRGLQVFPVPSFLFLTALGFDHNSHQIICCCDAIKR